ncbi:MAG: hypothetical protein Salg2KO_16910 [Salibacteraceae bacterium]
MRHKAHASFIIAALILLISLGVVQAQEPQFKMWIAFEDDSAQKDTVWVVIDESASINNLDTVLGEQYVELDSSKFQVYIGFSNYRKVIASPPHPEFGTMYTEIRALNVSDSIKMCWDTAAFRKSTLPDSLRMFVFESNGIYSLGYPNGFNVFDPYSNSIRDSLSLEPFYIGGVPGPHFPISIYASYEEQGVGFKSQSVNDPIQFRPNPASNLIYFSRSVGFIRLFNTAGVLVYEHSQPNMNDMDISGLTPGVYILQITDRTGSYNQRLIKQ